MIPESKMIRYDFQSAHREKITKHFEYMEGLGMELIQAEYSSFGACFFIEVRNYVPDPKDIYQEIETPADKFEWGTH